MAYSLTQGIHIGSSVHAGREKQRLNARSHLFGFAGERSKQNDVEDDVTKMMGHHFCACSTLRKIFTPGPAFFGKLVQQTSFLLSQMERLS